MIPDLKDQIQTLKSQVDSLQQKIIQLENNQPLQIKKALSELLKRSQAAKTDQQGDSNLKPNIRSSLQENDNKINLQVQEPRDEILKTLSEDEIGTVKPLSRSQQYNIPLNLNRGLNESNFITLGRLREEEKIEIIQEGFQRNQEGNISLRNYYESTQEYSLFQWKGYNLKYESIRRNKLYQTLKG